MASQVSFLQNLIDDGKVLKTLEEYDKSKEIQLFRKIASKLGAGKNSIRIFDDWLDNVLPNQIKEMSFSENGYMVEFSFDRFTKPTELPQFYRNRIIPYTADLYIKCKVSKDGKPLQSKPKAFIIGKIPVMLGSKLCRLRGMSPQELLKAGECISDPFGYFIIKSEMSLITQEKARLSLPIIITDKKKGTPTCFYTSMHTKGTKILYMYIGRKWNTVKLRIPDVLDSDRTLPLFLAYYFLDENRGETNSLQKYIDMIKDYVPKKYKRRVHYFLNDSVLKYRNITNPVKYVVDKKSKNRNSSTNIDASDENVIDQIKDTIMSNLFIDIPDNKSKLQQLSFIVAKFAMTVVGAIEYESRDSWAYKRFEGPGNSMANLFMGLFEKSVLRTLEQVRQRKTYADFAKQLQNKRHVTEEFVSSFNDEVWSIKGYTFEGKSMRGWTRDNVSNSTDRLTPLSLFSQNDKNNTPTARKSRSADVREVQASQRNRHCPAETPEGENIGLNKYQTLLCTFSLGTTKLQNKEFVKKILDHKTDQEDFVVIFNGEVVLLPETQVPFRVDEDFASVVKGWRRSLIVSQFTEVYVDDVVKTIEIYTDDSRPTCPYLIVNPVTKKLVIDEKRKWNANFQDLLSSGCIEFISSREEENERFLLCTSIKKFRMLDSQNKINGIYNYSHCNIDPNQMFSTSTSVAPFTDRQPGPRTTYQAQMGKQALGSFCLNHHSKFYTSFKTLHRGARAFTETDTYFIPKMDIMPCGQTINVAFVTDADNQEDAVVVCEDAIESGLLSFYKYVTVKDITKKTDTVVFANPDPQNARYQKIEADGFPKINTYIEEGDCIIGKFGEGEGGNRENLSVFAGIGESGYVDRIYRTRVTNTTIIKVKLRKFNKYKAGDKEAFRYAQKGTIGRIEKRENMLRVASGPNKGMVPDLLFNPHGFPSRQTVGILLEGLLTKAALYNGTRVNVSAFRDIDVEAARQTLIDNGMDPDGYEDMVVPGSNVVRKVCFVPLYTQALKHHVSDKIAVRTNDNHKSMYTRQPVGGRAQGGAQKVGEMEQEAFVAYGSSGVLLDRMLHSSDEFKMVVCHKCGNILRKMNIDKTKYCCQTCGDDADPGVLTISYVFKLLMNLLMGMGIDVKLNTSVVKNM